MFSLTPCSKNYAWGKPRYRSIAALFARDDEDDDDGPCAEVWWGTHRSGPTFVIMNGFRIPLHMIHPACTYLLKVISVEKALSIQVHPKKIVAHCLHALWPGRYPDAHPKPEMAIALSDFTALCGFLPEDQIRVNMRRYPSFASFFTEDGFSLERLLDCGEDTARVAVESLEIEARGKPDSMECQMILDLIRTNPGDVGVFAPLFMNRVDLLPGQALVIPPHELHCYLHGDAVECMAPSDNVVRAGLTPKLKDTGILCAITHKGHREPIVLDAAGTYSHNCCDPYFTLHQWHHGDTIPPADRHSILLVIRGSGLIGGTCVNVGDSWLLESGTTGATVRGRGLVVVQAL